MYDLFFNKINSVVPNLYILLAFCVHNKKLETIVQQEFINDYELQNLILVIAYFFVKGLSIVCIAPLTNRPSKYFINILTIITIIQSILYLKSSILHRNILLYSHHLTNELHMGGIIIIANIIRVRIDLQNSLNEITNNNNYLNNNDTYIKRNIFRLKRRYTLKYDNKQQILYQKVPYNTTICNICTEDYKSQEDITILSCDHTYHNTCIDSWLKVSNICPTCNQII
jgi:hypothetical protein